MHIAQERGAFFRDEQASVAHHIHRNQSLGDELAHDRAPGIAVVFPADAERGELVMAKLPDARFGLAQENRDDVRLPEPLAGAVDAGEHLLGGNRAVKGLGRSEADIEIPARTAGLAELAYKPQPAAPTGHGPTTKSSSAEY